MYESGQATAKFAWEDGTTIAYRSEGDSSNYENWCGPATAYHVSSTTVCTPSAGSNAGYSSCSGCDPQYRTNISPDFDCLGIYGHGGTDLKYAWRGIPCGRSVSTGLCDMSGG